MSGRLTGEVALVTGAARGQGRAHALRLASEGADIIAIDIAGKLPPCVPYDSATTDDLAETVQLVEATGRRILASVVDTRDLDGLCTAVDNGVATLDGSTSSSPTPASRLRRLGTTSPPKISAMSWTSM